MAMPSATVGLTSAKGAMTWPACRQDWAAGTRKSPSPMQSWRWFGWPRLAPGASPTGRV